MAHHLDFFLSYLFWTYAFRLHGIVYFVFHHSSYITDMFPSPGNKKARCIRWRKSSGKYIVICTIQDKQFFYFCPFYFVGWIACQMEKKWMSNMKPGNLFRNPCERLCLVNWKRTKWFIHFHCIVMFGYYLKWLAIKMYTITFSYLNKMYIFEYMANIIALEIPQKISYPYIEGWNCHKTLSFFEQLLIPLPNYYLIMPRRCGWNFKCVIISLVVSALTHWGRIYASVNYALIGSDSDLSPVRHLGPVSI